MQPPAVPVADAEQADARLLQQVRVDLPDGRRRDEVRVGLRLGALHDAERVVVELERVGERERGEGLLADEQQVLERLLDVVAHRDTATGLPT